MSHSDLLKKLSLWTDSVVSMNGYKASFLEDAFRRYELTGKTDFVVMGHPKALSRYSLQKLERFITVRRNAAEFVGYGAYLSLLAGRKSLGTR